MATNNGEPTDRTYTIIFLVSSLTYPFPVLSINPL